MKLISKDRRRTFNKNVRLTPLLIIVTLLLSVAGCGKKGCGGDEESQDQAAVSADPSADIERRASEYEPSDPQHPVGELLMQVPTDAGSVALVRSWTDLLLPVGPLVDRAEAYIGDVSEALVQLRDQLGVDVRRPQDLVDIGIAPHGAMAFYLQNDAGVVATQTTDATKLRAHITEMLGQAPWGYDREPVTEEQAGATITQFGSSDAEEWEAALITQGTHARLVIRQSDDALPIEQVLQGVESSLLENAAFNRAWSTLADHHVVVWVDAAEVAEASPTLGGVSAPGGFTLEDVLAAAESAAYGLTFGDDRIVTELFVPTSENEVARELEAQMSLDPSRIGFEALRHDDAYGIARFNGPLDVAFRHGLAQLGGLEFNATNEELREVIGRDFDSTLADAIGDEVAFVMTRARIFTLTAILRSKSISSIGQLNDAFGLVTSMEILARSPVEEVLDYLGENGTLDFEKTQSDGASIYALNDESSTTGTMILTNNRLTMLPRRQSRELRSVMLTGDSDPMVQFKEETSRALLERPEFSGIAIDADELLNGPIGNQIVGQLPSRYRTIVNLFDEFTMTWHFDDGLRIESALRLSDAPTTPPE